MVTNEWCNAKRRYVRELALAHEAAAHDHGDSGSVLVQWEELVDECAELRQRRDSVVTLGLAVHGGGGAVCQSLL